MLRITFGLHRRMGMDRSSIMRAVRRKDTVPEMVVRRLLHRLGFRFRLHKKGLPGTPDIVLPKYRVAIFVNGCFWHRHPGCRRATTPKSNQAYWESKFSENVNRDVQKTIELQALGWKVVVVWECETKDQAVLGERLIREVGDAGAHQRAPAN